MQLGNEQGPRGDPRRTAFVTTCNGTIGSALAVPKNFEVWELYFVDFFKGF